jgi:UDP-glucose:(heptosyl)LPS alpha-1,3-glucosyltransferase
MNLAFCLFRFFPYGGLQRDFLRIARTCLQRGHRVRVFAMSWEGEVPADLDLRLVPARGLSNHARCRSFVQGVLPLLAQGGYDAVIGFNKMPGLDLYYAADTCFQARSREKHGILFRLGSRYRTFMALERSVFSPTAGTEILLISPMEKTRFQRFYNTPDERFHLLPPGISPDRIAPENSAEIRVAVRRELGMTRDEKLVLMVGSAFKTKGLDRALRAIAALPAELQKRTRLVVVGRGESAPFLRLARKLGVLERLTLLGGRDDVPRFLLAADLLLHPAYTENTGTVLLEALAAGLPVLATEICGYGFHVLEAQAGLLVPEPFRQEQLDWQLLQMLTSAAAEGWRENALVYVRRTDIFSLPEKAADLIEETGRRKCPMLELRSDLQNVFTGEDAFDRILSSMAPFTGSWGTPYLRFEIDGRGYFLKAHFASAGGRFSEPAAVALARARAQNEKCAIERLEQLGVETMTIAGFGTRGKNPARLESFLITDELRETVSLEDFCRDWAKNAPPSRLKKALIEKVAGIARTLHENGVNHRDFYICHFLLPLADLDLVQRHEPFRLHLIDLHRVQLRNRAPRRWIVKDVAGLFFSSLDIGLSRRDVLRFMRRYSGKTLPVTVREDRAFWQQVRQRAVRLYEKDFGRTPSLPI